MKRAKTVYMNPTSMNTIQIRWIATIESARSLYIIFHSLPRACMSLFLGALSVYPILRLHEEV